MRVNPNPSDLASLTPRRAIVFNTIADGLGSIATDHRVQPHPETGAPTIGAGMPMDRQAIKRMVHELEEQSKIEPDFLPTNVLVSEVYMMAWWRRSGVRQIFFKTGDKDLDALNGREVLHPPLLFVAMPRIQGGSSARLYAYAINEDVRPYPECRLYRAPYMNAELSGLICGGDAPMPSHPTLRNLADYEKAFFDFSFVHFIPGVDQKVTAHPDGHTGFWQRMADRAARGIGWIVGDSLVPQPPVGDSAGAVATVERTLKALWKKQ